MKSKLLFGIVIMTACTFSMGISAQLHVASTGSVTMSEHVSINGATNSDSIALNVNVPSSTVGRTYGIYSSFESIGFPDNMGVGAKIGLLGQVKPAVTPAPMKGGPGGGSFFTYKLQAGIAGVAASGIGVYGATKDYLPNSWSGGNYAGYFDGNMKVTGTLTATTITQTSDARFKKNISMLSSEYSRNLLSQLTPVSYMFKNDSNLLFIEEDKAIHYGFIAQEVQKVIPELVYEDSAGYLSINYTELIPLLVKSLNDQQKQIDELTTEIETLRHTSDTSMSRLAPNSTHSSSGVRQPVLYQNSPNPFSISTAIAYELPENSLNADIIIYDMNGHQLKIFPVTEFGHGSVTVKAGSLAPGMYMYTLIVDNEVIDTKRMILTK